MLKFTLKRLASLAARADWQLFHLCYVPLRPGDPVRMMLGESATPEAQEALREEMGLNDPLLQGGRGTREMVIVHQDLGTSYTTQRPVLGEILNVFPNTVTLAVAAVIIAIVVDLFRDYLVG